jgi:hypothetical protein
MPKVMASISQVCRVARHLCVFFAKERIVTRASKIKCHSVE